MERLTERWANGTVHRTDAKGDSVMMRLAAYEDTNLTPEEVAELAQAKADGRLVDVVRCRECVHWANGSTEKRPCHKTDAYPMAGNDYCSYGETRALGEGAQKGDSHETDRR